MKVAIFVGGIMAVLLLVVGFYAVSYIDYRLLTINPGENQGSCPLFGEDERRGDPDSLSYPTEDVHIIELSDSGEYSAICQRTVAFYDLNWDHPGSKVQIRKELLFKKGFPKLVVLYVHGWLHRATPDIKPGDSKADEDYSEFKYLINLLRTENKDKNVVGIYIDWNAVGWFIPNNSGWSTLINWLGPVNYLSFWHKQYIADRIAQSSVLTSIISSVSNILRKDWPSPDQFISIGHSFGARILFSATSQLLVYEDKKSYPKLGNNNYSVMRAPIDLTILLNPAFEAARYFAIYGLDRGKETFSELQLPLSMIIATDNDWTTQKIFPIAQWFGGEWDPEERTTVGNFEKFKTHDLTLGNETTCLSSKDQQLTEEFYSNHICLKRESGTQYFPFIVAHTTAQVINGHGDIWNCKFRQWLFSFINTLTKQNGQGIELSVTPPSLPECPSAPSPPP